MTARLVRLLRPGKYVRWAWGIGLGLPIVLGLVLVLLIVISLVTGGYEPPKLLVAGPVDGFPTDMPRHYENERFWMVHLKSDEFVALYDRDPLSKCTIAWRPEYELMGRTGWFRDSCLGSSYDVSGRCFEGPCQRGLDRLRVTIEGSSVYVNLSEIAAGPVPDAGEQPENPAQ